MEYRRNFLRFYLTKNEILRVSVKDKSCNSPEGLQLYWKETARHFPVHIPKLFRDCFFNRTTPVAAFEVSFSIKKEFQKKKVNGEIVFALITVLILGWVA